MGDRGRRPGLLLAVISVYLIVTMQSRTSDANSIFFLQLLISPVLVFAVASAWHFARGRAWFNGERERPLRAEESGARPITAPLIGGGPSAAATRRSSARARRSPSTARDSAPTSSTSCWSRS